MASYVTPQTYDSTKVVLGDIMVKTDPVPFQRIPIKYQYDNGPGPLVVRTHQMFSFGLCETTDMQSKTGKVVGYSMPFVSYDAKEGKQQADEEFIGMIESITNTIRERVSDPKVLSELRQKRKKKVDVESLSLMKMRLEKPDAPPVMFVKLRTEYGTDPPKINTPFYRKATRGEKDRTGKSIVKVKNPLEYLKKKCTIIGGIAIESVFVGGIVESIVTKLTEVVVVKKLDYQASIMSDLQLEADSDSEEEEEDEEPQKQRKTIKVGRVEDDEDEDEVEDEEEDDDTTFRKLQAIRKKN